MRKRSFATLGVLALLATASAFGQQRMRVDIPFEFHLMDNVMPAGQYIVDTAANNVLSLDCRACRSHAVAAASGIGGGANLSTEARLVFNKYGDSYFLSEVWTPGYSLGEGLSRSKTEHEIAHTTPAVARITVPARTSHAIIARR